ncbi:hypothetical protein BGX12_14317 [Fibrobacter sp. UWR4]|nr:hypothetical protein BGX12_14317 [Fibrobacter sp. UWR4]PZW63437.1 hypothetical protein C8E88_10455 [Fibrobacter sp. UWR1]
MRNVFALVFFVCVFAWSKECHVFERDCELCSFEISDSALAMYEKQPKPSDTVEAFKVLEKNINVYFTDRIDMEEKLKMALADFPQFHKRINNNSLGSKAVKAKIMDRYPDDSIPEMVWLDSAYMDSLKYYIRVEAESYPYSPTVKKFVENLKVGPFIDSNSMHRYALSLFAASLGICYDTVNAYDKIKDVLWSDVDFDDLVRRLHDNNWYGAMHKKGTDLCLDSIRHIKRRLDRRYRFMNCSEDRWKNALVLLDTLYSKLLAGVVDSMTQRRVSEIAGAPVVWKADGCGCSRKNQLNGTVYAIFPYWQVKKEGNIVDFSAVTRLAFYGLGAANDGSLRLPTGENALDFFDRPGYSEFVNQAHRHDVKVDWIITKNDWSSLAASEVKLRKFFDILITRIDSLVSKRNNTFFQRLVDNVSMVQDDVGNRGDGVTLWFKNYPTDSVSTAVFNEKFRELHRRLLEKNEYAFVNFMTDRMSLSEKMNVRKDVDSTCVPAAKGIYSYENFRQLMSIPVRAKDDSITLANSNVLTADEILNNLRNHLIVFADEPVSRSRLLIFSELDQQMRGEDRKIVHHSLVPLLWLDNTQWSQLREEASFYNDTYYSLGVAPYGTCGVSDSVCAYDSALASILLSEFEKDDGDHERQGTFASFACAHRWFFRLLNVFAYSLAILLIVCYFAVCRVGEYFVRHLALFVGLVVLPPLLTTMTLLRTDPVLENFLGSVGPWGCFIAIIVSVVVIALLQVYRSAEYPKRKKRK